MVNKLHTQHSLKGPVLQKKCTDKRTEEPPLS